MDNSYVSVAKQKLTPLFGRLEMNVKKLNEQNHFRIFILLITSNFHSSERNEKNEIRFNEIFTKTPKISMNIQPFILN